MNEPNTPGKKTNPDNTELAKDYLALLESFHRLQDSRDHYAALYDYAPAGYAVLDQKGYIKDINHTGARLLGAKKTSVLDMPLSAYIIQTDIRIFLNHLSKCNKAIKPVQTEVTLVNKRREVQLLSLRISAGKPEYLGTNIVDITEKKKIEREVARLDRLQIIGEMAAGIAHEIRNPMTTVLGYLQLFQKKAQMADYHESFSMMANELLRANAIITEFLSLAKNKDFTPAYLDLNQIIMGLHPLVNAEALMQGQIISIELTESLPLVLMDENEIRQVILNLTRNGLQAMNAGILHIRTYIEQGNVVLAIEDHGSGIPKEVQSKIGTPFFTTKATGTGLGLPVCFNIAARHNAELKFATGDGGTTFFLRFGPDTVRERSNP